MSNKGKSQIIKPRLNLGVTPLGSPESFQEGKLTATPPVPFVAVDYELLVAARNPRNWWKLGETFGYQYADNGSNPITMEHFGAVQIGQTGIIDTGGKAPLFFSAGTGNLAGLHASFGESVPLTYPFTIECWTVRGSESISANMFSSHTAVPCTSYAGVRLLGISQNVWVFEGTGLGFGGTENYRFFGTNETPGIFIAGQLTHIVATTTALGVWKIFVNGVEYAVEYKSGTGSSLGAGSGHKTGIGYYGQTSIPNGAFYNGKIQHVVFYQEEFTETIALSHYIAGTDEL